MSWKVEMHFVFITEKKKSYKLEPVPKYKKKTLQDFIRIIADLKAGWG